jgi:hypothetical protein
MGIDMKYGRITVEKVRERPIGDDEPIFLFRAQDKLLPDLLDYYYSLCEQAGSPSEHLRGIEDASQRIVEWQDTHYTQTPGSSEVQ